MSISIYSFVFCHQNALFVSVLSFASFYGILLLVRAAINLDKTHSVKNN